MSGKLFQKIGFMNQSRRNKDIGQEYESTGGPTPF